MARVRRLLLPLWMAAGLAICVSSLARLQADSPAADWCNTTGIERIVAVGDVHGAYERFVHVLQTAGIVDEQRHWSGGRAHLVQNGDVTDRGNDVRKSLDFLMQLEEEAKAAGGFVHALVGNHEVMDMIGDFRYVTPAALAEYQKPDSEAKREEYYKKVVAAKKVQSMRRGQLFDADFGFRRDWLAKTPLGAAEMSEDFAANGRYGKWIRGHDAMVRLNGVAFMHGGLSPDVASTSCGDINKRIRKEIADAERMDVKEALTTRPEGPLWYRGLAQEPEDKFSSKVDEILKKSGVTAIVVGHTVTGDGQIHSRFGGRVFQIDVGMTDMYGGHEAALEIAGPTRTFTAIYPDRKAVLTH